MTSLPRSKSPSRAGSPGGGSSTGAATAAGSGSQTLMAFPRELLGVPVIREVEGRRRLSLVVELGSTFTAKEVTVLIIKESRLQVCVYCRPIRFSPINICQWCYMAYTLIN